MIVPELRSGDDSVAGPDSMIVPVGYAGMLSGPQGLQTGAQGFAMGAIGGQPQLTGGGHIG